MAASPLLSSRFTSEVGLRLLLCPLASNVVLRTACCSVGVVLPVYSTFKAIERKDQNEQERWLIYWAAYGSFTIAEIFSDKLLSWFPMYYYAKFAFLVWLQFPPSFGSKYLYMRHLRPLFLQHQASLDRVAFIASSEISKFMCAHQAEIQYTMALLRKCVMAACRVFRDASQPGENHQRPLIEGSERVVDLESSSDDN